MRETIREGWPHGPDHRDLAPLSPHQVRQIVDALLTDPTITNDHLLSRTRLRPIVAAVIAAGDERVAGKIVPLLLHWWVVADVVVVQSTGVYKLRKLTREEWLAGVKRVPAPRMHTVVAGMDADDEA